MFLVVDAQRNNLVFLDADPRADGYDGPVQTDVSLEAPWGDPRSWEGGGEGPPRVGSAFQDPNLFRLFRTERECRETPGFRPHAGNPVWRHAAWRDYQRACTP